jgi:tetratricopeptide (TPR) repeat protein
LRPAPASAVVAGLFALAACAPALRTPPPVAAIGGAAPSRDAHRPGPEDVDRLLEEGAVAFARRPDMAAVSDAYSTYLAAARGDDSRVEGLVGAMKAAAWLIEHEPAEARRSSLSTEAVQAGQWCRQRAPANIECTYRLALALGQQARERRSTAKDGLEKMVGLLEAVVAGDPGLDHAGGHRVLALVLLRAPGWPAGPGDPEAALEHSREADRISPNTPDNLLALAEALEAAGQIPAARSAYERAERLARAQAAAGDPDARESAESAARALKALKQPSQAIQGRDTEPGSSGRPWIVAPIDRGSS